MSPGVAARKWLGGGGGFALGCGCKDAKAVAVAVSASSLCSATETSTATTATWRKGRTHPSASASASASTGTLTVPSASSSFLWEDAEADADGDEVGCKRESSAATPSFSCLLRQLNELEQSVMLWGRMKSPRRNYSSPPPPPPPPLPYWPVQHRAVHRGDKRNGKEGHVNFSPPGPPPPPPPLPSRPVQHRALHSSDKRNSKEGHGNFSPPPSFQFPTQQHQRVKSVDKVNIQEGDVHRMPPPPPPLPLPPQQTRNVKTVDRDRGNSKGDGKHLAPPQAPKHRTAKSCDNNDSSGGGGRLDGSVAVVKQSEDPLGDFRRSMLNMIVENRIVTEDELRELLRRFLALNAPHHHDAILRAFAEIWDEVFAPAAGPYHEPTSPTVPRQRTPPRRRHPPPAWRL